MAAVGSASSVSVTAVMVAADAVSPAALRSRKGAARAGEGGVSPAASDRLTVQAGGSTARCRAGSKEGAVLADFGLRGFNGMIIASIGIAPPLFYPFKTPAIIR